MEVQGLLPTLLGWAAYLSGYPMPAQLPALRFEAHAFFVQEVCAGRECNVVGWYNDRGIVYVDERLRAGGGGFATSLLVHELTHYLQHLSGRFDSRSCSDSLLREREAYGVQNEYILTAQASIEIVFPAPTACAYDLLGDVALAGAEARGAAMP